MNNKKSADKIIIRKESILEGIYLSKTNAERFYSEAQILYNTKKFHLAIPIATISTEESKKTIELFVRFSEGKDITRTDWQNLTNHEYKLKHDFDEGRKYTENLTEEQHMQVYENFARMGLPFEKL